MPDRDQSPEDLPQAVVDALKRADRAPAVITRSVDRAVVNAARTHFGAPSERRAWRQRGGWAALAASVALITVLAVRWDALVARDDRTPYADVDNSGRVDIADVLALARAGTASPAELDAFARRVVSLDTGASR